MTIRVVSAGLLAAAGLVLQACSGGADDGGETAEVSSDTLALLVADQSELSIVSETLGDAGLAQVFDGAAAYTLLAPRDAAFEELGEAAQDLQTAEQRPAMVAILRDHIVPGYLTPDDIGKAIELDADGSVVMRTMGDHTLTFTSEGDSIAVSSEDGAKAHFAGEALRASNGVAIPLDGVLKQAPPAPPAS